MNNIFLLDYGLRLRSWVELRESIKSYRILDQSVSIDKFWQSAPISTYYLHTDLIKSWPNPWQLLSDNVYCNYARALGMIYTLLLVGNKNIDLVDAVDDNNNEVALVLVDDAKYVLNYWPDTVVNNHITDFVITRQHDLTPLYSKIG